MTAYLASLAVGALSLHVLATALEMVAERRYALAALNGFGVLGLILLAIDTWGLA